ncbi:MAG TPA: PP2C family protein-serine/threonine phosphatase [Tepidisphaeraceae bacterium]
MATIPTNENIVRHPPGLASLIDADWPQRLSFVVEMMREMSRQTDPQMMVQVYGKRMRQVLSADGSVSLSRRGLEKPYYRITRASKWERAVNPWKSTDRLPLLKGGLLADLIWGEQPVIIDDLEVADDDPAAEFLRPHRSAVAIPLYDQGHSLNMVVIFRNEPGAFNRETLPEHLWLSNLFGRATHNLVLSGQLRDAYDAVDRELQVVADIQRSLLPVELPKIPTLDLAAYYQTSKRAGGDYYDFFELPDGRWGFLIADVSGHGTPAAVMMAVTHSIAHTLNDEPDPPSRLLNFINQHLTARYTGGKGTFVTAFYGIYDPKTRTLTYSNAGHNPPRHKRAGQIVLGSLEGTLSLPLGIESDEHYADATQTFAPGDAVIFYTDGITEARDRQNELFSQERLDQVLLSADFDAADILNRVLKSVDEFTQGAPATDDRTLLVAKVR